MEKDRIPALFGSNVFNEDAMRRYLPAEAVSAWRDCLENGRHLGLPLANAIADGMKNWALEHGATHYTHWFQPMTGYTAEKHHGFVTPRGARRGAAGMKTKLRAAHRATTSGTETHIVSGKDPEALYRVIRGEPTGTRFIAK